jgi:hypothetical protein
MHIILGGSLTPDSPIHVIDCQDASILYRFESGAQVTIDTNNFNSR